MFCLEYQPDKNKFLIGVRRTAIVTTLSTSTVTVGSTCYTKVKTSTCSGKKKKRRSVLDNAPNVMDNINDDGIEGSLSKPIEISNGDGELEKLVIWTTSTQTITWYSSSTKTGTTLTVAYSCTASGISLPGVCG